MYDCSIKSDKETCSNNNENQINSALNSALNSQRYSFFWIDTNSAFYYWYIEYNYNKY